ncbi:MAG: DUF2757 family protein [Desulfotomaculaceae bacterium]|nr:DUF2757 family protein [Desulfotomaculaceae bacterium]
MKLIYVCECCDVVVHSLEAEELVPGEIPSALTGTEPLNIINMSASGEQVTLTTLCEECLEEMYGGPESNYFSGPLLN